MVLKPSRQLKSYFLEVNEFYIICHHVIQCIWFDDPSVLLSLHKAHSAWRSHATAKSPRRAAQRTRVFHAVMPGDAGSGQTPRSWNLKRETLGPTCCCCIWGPVYLQQQQFLCPVCSFGSLAAVQRSNKKIRIKHERKEFRWVIIIWQLELVQKLSFE